MNLVPYLANQPQLNQATAASVRKSSMTEGVLGSLAPLLDQTEIIDILLGMNCAVKTCDDLMCHAWSSAVAREMLLAASWGVKVADELWTTFVEATPLDDVTPLRELRGRDLVAACFPLEKGLPEETPPWAMFFIFEGNGARGSTDGRSRLSEWSAAKFDPQGNQCFIQCSRADVQNIKGLSWTLAAALARQALVKKDAKLRRQLALGWMLTGWVDENKSLRRIDLGNKLNIETSRQWLFPVHNRGEVIGQAEKLSDAYFPPTFDAAWSIVSGEGAVDGGETTWPKKADVLHSFTSGAWAPVVASLLLSAPRKLVLWHSDDPLSKNPAKALKEVLRPGFWTDTPPDVELQPVCSDNLAEAQRQIRRRLEKDLAVADSTVLFNITQGNRVMGLAPHGLAQLHPNLWLLYRDLNAAHFRFEVIRYKGVHPTAEHIPDPAEEDRSEPARSVPREIWDRLFNLPKPGQPLGTTVGAIFDALGGRAVGEKVHFPTEKGIASAFSSL